MMLLWVRPLHPVQYRIRRSELVLQVLMGEPVALDYREDHLLAESVTTDRNGGVLKISWSLFGAPITRIIIRWGPYLGPIFLGNYQIPRHPRTGLLRIARSEVDLAVILEAGLSMRQETLSSFIEGSNFDRYALEDAKVKQQSLCIPPSRLHVRLEHSWCLQASKRQIGSLRN